MTQCDLFGRAEPAPASHPPLPDASNPVTVGYGMGDNSTAMLIEMHRRGEPPPALIMFADTGGEMARTYAYLPIIDAWLRSVGWPEITVVKNASPIAGDASLYDECHRKSVLPSLAYGGHSCSLKWKVAPQDKYARQMFGWNGKRQSWAHGPWLTKLIGYDAGPADRRRVKNAVGKWPPGYQYRYPLVEWAIDREACERIIVDAGLPLAGKSSCWFCPAMKKHEVDQLAAHHPDLADKAMELESRAHERGLVTVKGLGRNWSWTDHIRPAPPPLLQAAGAASNRISDRYRNSDNASTEEKKIG
jgi:hypothetical protein